MTVSITDGRTIFDQLDAVGSWTSSPSLFTSNPSPIEATGCLGWIVSATTANCTLTSGSRGLAQTLVYVWVRAFGYMDTYANGGVGIIIGDGTNTVAYYVGGSDQGGFRHTSGGAEWVCYMLDTGSLPSGKTVISGSEASMSWGAITTLGIRFTTTYKAVGGVQNCFADIYRYGNGGLIVGGGSASAGDFSEIAAEDALIKDQGAYGMCRELASGAYGLQGPLTFGDNSGTSSTGFASSGETVIFEPPPSGIVSTRFWFDVVGNSTGTNTFECTSDNFICPAGIGAAFTATDSNVDGLTLDSCLIQGFETAITFASSTLGGDWRVSDCIFDGCAQLNLGYLLQDGEFSGNTISNTVASTTGALLLGSTGYTSGLDLTTTTFVSGGTGHAIYITQAGTYDFTDLVFSGYGAGGTTNASVYNNSGGSVTINASNCTGLTVRNGSGASTTVVTDPVTTTITVKDINTGTVLQYARVLLVASSAAGELPYQESVTSITRSGSTATVTHSSHGMATGDFALISGANQEEYNGAFEITVTGTNTYTYTVPGTPATPATGTIISTGGIFNTQTNASGIVTDSRSISLDQPVVGRVRLSTGSTLYKSSPISETIDSSNGLLVTVYLIPDD